MLSIVNFEISIPTRVQQIVWAPHTISVASSLLDLFLVQICAFYFTLTVLGHWRWGDKHTCYMEEVTRVINLHELLLPDFVLGENSVLPLSVNSYPWSSLIHSLPPAVTSVLRLPSYRGTQYGIEKTQPIIARCGIVVEMCTNTEYLVGDGCVYTGGRWDFTERGGGEAGEGSVWIGF